MSSGDSGLIIDFDKLLEAARIARGRTLARLRDYDVYESYVFLCKKGADPEKILTRVAALVSYSPKVEPRRLDRRKVESYANRIEATAELMEYLNGPRVLGTDFLSSGDWRETWAIPSRLREYAARLQCLPSEVAERWEPVKTAAICQLIWYVKDSTHTYRDEHVSALIGAALKDGSYTTGAHKEWRNRHGREIADLGPLEIMPHLSRPPRSR